MLSVSSEAVSNQVISLADLSNFFLEVQNSIQKGELNFDFDYALKVATDGFEITSVV